jgi:NADH-quinone oxidoreductase subunit G
MEGYQGQPPSSLIARFWVPGWNSVQAVNHYQAEVGGPLRGGDPGKRVIEPGSGTPPPYVDRIPPRFEPAADEWLCVPLHHIFGSEELSVLAPAIVERMAPAYVALGTDDLRRANVTDGDEVLLTVGDTSHRLVARGVSSMPSGIAGVPVGLPSMPWVPIPAKGRIHKVEPSR